MLLGYLQDFGLWASLLDHQNRQAASAPKARLARGAGVKIEHALILLQQWNVAMTTDGDIRTRCGEVATEFGGFSTNMRNIDATARKRQRERAREMAIKRAAPIDVAGDCADRRYALESVDDLLPANITRMDNPLNALEKLQRLLRQNAMGI